MATNDIDFNTPIRDMKAIFAEQKRYLDRGLAEMDRQRERVRKILMSEREKRDVRIKAERAKASRAESAKIAQALANQRRAFGPSGPVIVSGPDVAGLPRHPKNSGDLGNDTPAGDGGSK
jgi:hypothetical protein